MNAIPASATPLRTLELTRCYGRKTALDRLSIDLQPGQVLGLIGRNGAGKSTLLRCLLGLCPSDAGQAWLFGEPSDALSDAVKARIAYVPQQPSALGWLRVGDMLDFIGRFYPQWDATLVADLLQRWEIDRSQPMSKLSPGERQRLALIRALAARPELLILDEPAAALDPVARRELLREIVLRAAEHGTTVLFSTHILSDLERVASHVAFIDHGRLLVHDELDAIKERFVRIVLPAAEAGDAPLPGELRRKPVGGDRIALLLDTAQRRGWPERLQARDADFEALGLEDLFLEVVA